MSYDIAIIDHHPRFNNCKEFLAWYDDAIGHQQDDYRQGMPALQQWFLKMKERVRPLNGEFAPAADEIDAGEFPEADYGFGKDFIYVALAHTDAEKTSALAFELAKECRLAYFDISGTGELHNADGSHFHVSRQQAVYDELEEENQKEFNKRNSITTYIAMPLIILLLFCLMFMDSWGVYVGIPTLIIFIAFAYWSNRWTNRSGQDVLRKYQQSVSSPTTNEHVEELPPLLSEIAWNFRLGSFDSQEEFFTAVMKYNEEVQGRSVEKFLKEKIGCVGAETTFILFEDFSEDAGEQQSSKTHFACDDGVSFSGVEILYKLNQELYPILVESDFIFFEGFNCYQLAGGSTVCRLLLGS